MRLPFLSAVMTAVLVSSAAAQMAPSAVANDNRKPAGALRDGVLTLSLNVVRATWHPDRDDDPGVEVLALQEAGQRPSIPAPLIRVPTGTEIRTTVRNTLTDSSVIVFGLSGARMRADSVRIKPGESRELITHATSPGTFVYFAETSLRTVVEGRDRVMSGAFVVDAPGEPTDDRVLVLHEFVDTTLIKPFPGAIEGLFTINGRAWPNTERLSYPLGQKIRWRVVNGSFNVHPMHLHGAYFKVLSRGFIGSDTTYTGANTRDVVTERMLPLTTMMIEWQPERAGNWLFHCHLPFHVQPHPPLGEMKASDDHAAHALHGMGGLVLGTTIVGAVAKDATPRRKLRLFVNAQDSIPGDFVPRFSYSLERPSSTWTAGPTIVVKRNEPIAITVINRTGAPTAVHWHGLEIESFFDGAAGFSGTPTRISPMIAPNDSFVAKLVPPRAGTFIYHSHSDELRQIGGGLSGAFVVLPENEKWNPETDRVVVVAQARDSTVLAINGEKQPQWRMEAGKTYRLRLINITLGNPNLTVAMLRDDQVQTWTVVAKDGMDWIPSKCVAQPARRQISIGETYDVLFKPEQAGSYKFGVVNAAGKLLRWADVSVTD